MQYPDEYRMEQTQIIKFERDYNSSLQYTFFNLFPQNVTNVTGSTENNILLFSVDSTIHTATNEVWGYKWYTSGDRRAQSAWFRWTLPNNVIFQTMMDDKYYVVLNTGSTYTLEKFDIKLSSDTVMIGTAPDEIGCI